MEVFNQAVPIYLDEQTRMIRYLAWEHVGTCLDWDDHTQICLMANCAAVPFYDILAEDALGYDLECPPLIVLDCHPQQLGTSLTFITWLAQGCARTHTHTQDWFWDLKLFPKGVLLEVRIEVEKVETAEKVEKVESTDFKNCVNGNTAQHWTGTEINSSSSNCFGAGTHGWSIRASWDSCKELRWAELCKSPLPPCSELYAALLASQQTIVGTVPCAKGSHTHTRTLLVWISYQSNEYCRILNLERQSTNSAPQAFPPQSAGFNGSCRCLYTQSADRGDHWDRWLLSALQYPW